MFVQLTQIDNDHIDVNLEHHEYYTIYIYT